MRRATVGLGIGAVLWVVLPLGLLALLTVSSLSANISGPQSPSWVPVRSSDSATTEPVDIALQWQPPAKVYAPAWNGLVQSVQTTPGQVLSDGTPVVTIDGVVRRAAITPAPLYRSIAVGMRGTDVEWLNEFLGRMGYAHGSTQVATGATVQGAKQYATAVGAQFQGSFDVSWLIFVPSSGFTVQTVALTPGTPAPATGSVIMESSPTLSRATVVTLGSLDSLVSQQQAASATPTPLSDSTVNANRKEVPADTQLEVSGGTVPVDKSSAALATALPKLQSLVAPLAPVLQANLMRAARPGDYLIPSAAVFSGASGKTCVAEKTGGNTRTVKVTIVADSAEGVVVTGPLDLRGTVRVPGGSQTQCG